MKKLTILALLVSGYTVQASEAQAQEQAQKGNKRAIEALITLNAIRADLRNQLKGADLEFLNKTVAGNTGLNFTAIQTLACIENKKATFNAIENELMKTRFDGASKSSFEEIRTAILERLAESTNN